MVPFLVQSGIILTAGCLFVYFRQFEHYGVSATDLFSANNRYFPATDDATSKFYATDGTHRVYDVKLQNHILWVAQGGWYLMIVCGQAAHIWVCRTTTVSIFEHGIFGNRVTNAGVVIALLLGSFITYCPGLQDIVQTHNPWSLIIFESCMWTSWALWSWAEGRKFITRRLPREHLFNRIFAW